LAGTKSSSLVTYNNYAREENEIHFFHAEPSKIKDISSLEINEDNILLVRDFDSPQVLYNKPLKNKKEFQEFLKFNSFPTTAPCIEKYVDSLFNGETMRTGIVLLRDENDKSKRFSFDIYYFR